eukprot:scaffold5534_cov146-Skeletonema_menzelii.AAC.2
MPPQLFRRRVVRASSPEEDTFDEYKEIMEEIKRERPDIPLSAVQQMAVERFSSSTKEKRLSQNNLMTAMSNFRFGKGIKAKEDDPTTNDNDTNEPEDRRRRLNPRVSVKNLDVSSLSQSFKGGISSEDEDSLEGSLENIEAFATPRRQASRRVSMKRTSMTISSTELLDVQEDEELLQASIPGSLAQNSTDKTQSSGQNSGQNSKNSTGPQGSISDDLPDEIKLALAEYGNDDDRQNLGADGKSENRRRGRESIRSSNASSFASIDSAAFEGDFSAWS